MARRTPASALVPAAVRAPEIVLTRAEEEIQNGEAVELFATAVGGRAKLADVLAVAETAPEVEKVINLLLDPRYRTYSLRRLCTLTGISVAELFAAYRKALITRAHIEASHIIASRLVPIVEDVMTRAMPVPIACSACQAEEARRPTCPVCRGTGTTLSEPDFDRQKLALELGQLLEKKGGLTITQNQGVVAAGALAANGGGSLEQLHQAVGDLLFTPGRTRSASPYAPVSEPPVEYPPAPIEEPPDLPLGTHDDDADDDAEEEDRS
jgi:hypothetical protein